MVVHDGGSTLCGSTLCDVGSILRHGGSTLRDWGSTLRDVVRHYVVRLYVVGVRLYVMFLKQPVWAKYCPVIYVIGIKQSQELFCVEVDPTNNTMYVLK